MKSGHKYEYKLIKANLLKVDRTYQRQLSNARVQRIVNEFDPDMVNEPKVSQREDGSYYIFNGQHTTAVERKVYGPDCSIICKVYYGLTWEEEKELFVRQNGISKDPTTTEKLRAEYNAENKDVRAMVASAERSNVTVDFGNYSGSYRCIAVTALFNAYKKVGADILTEILDVICKAWSGESLSFSGGFIGGLALLYKNHSDMFKKNDLIRSLSMHTPDFYVREAKDMNGRQDNRFYRLFVRVYNNKRSTRKLTV